MKVILTHENADFDALASLLGARKLYPDAVPVLPRRLNRNLRRFLTLYEEEMPFVRLEDLSPQPIEQAIVVDTQTFVSPKGMGTHTRVRVIDHHPLSRELPSNITFSGEETGATVTLLVEQISEAGIPLSPIEATLLLLGIYEDTGSLSYSTTTPQDVRCAAWLMERGANLSVVNDFLRYPLTEAQRQLYTQLERNSQTHEFSGRSVVVATASASEYTEEISTLAPKLRDLLEPDALILLVKLDDRIQLVARSTGEALDVAEIAAHFGGGGHSQAAAAAIHSRRLDEVCSALLDLLPTYVKPAATVGQIMSYGVHTFPPDTTVAKAEEAMRRYGHEGFPVVEEGGIVGLVARREIDKALHHGLGDAPVRLFMHKGEIKVSPEDSVKKIQRVMMDYDVGQVPVVKEGKILGIVTRTDLIELWAAPRRPRARERSRAMERVLPHSLIELLKKASQVASETGFSLYVVGGFVRDLLLGVPNLDLDLVVEGEAIALAKRLAEEVEGRVHSHARFGTAKLISEDEEVPHLDFATARMEFYEHPTALPQVERSSIKQDLHRRDFTINTLAICLDPDRYGELLDFYGGERDLNNGLIRVLHSLSFVEDPTRMLRAVRLEQRLGFAIEEHTEELLRGALELLDRVSGERIRHELYLILQEDEPGKALARLHELGVLVQIHPALKCDDWLMKRFRGLRESLEAGSWKLATRERKPEISILYLALLTFRMSLEELDDLGHRLKLSRYDAAPLRQVHRLRTLSPELAEDQLKPSAIYRLLEPFSIEAILVHWVATDSELVRQRLELYHRQLRHVRPEIDGTYLKGMELPPGPIYSRILDALLDARLDGEVTNLSEEEALVKEMLAAGTR